MITRTEQYKYPELLRNVMLMEDAGWAVRLICPTGMRSDDDYHLLYIVVFERDPS